MRTLVRAPALASLLLLGGAGCLDDDLAAGGTQGATFIALQSDFQAFRTWERFLVGTEPVDVGHPDPGSRYAYLDARPPAGAIAFPVGTMIVKATETGEPTNWVIHAMVKRGGGFNVGGAIGWEYFDLQIDDDDNAVILWRGFEPPSGHGYGPEGDDSPECNGCHATGDAYLTDYVLSPPLAPGAL